MTIPWNAAEIVPLVLYEDPLSPWCLVAERRIAAILEDVPAPFRLRLEPFPLLPEPRVLGAPERRALARSARKAAREPEARGTVPDLWNSPDPPLSSIPVLAALLAARLQGGLREGALRERIREAALVRGVNPSRADVLYELAEQVGLDVDRFAGALAGSATERRVREVHERALEHGICQVPALVIGDEWLVAGPRPTEEYRAILSRYLASRLGVAPLRTLH